MARRPSPAPTVAGAAAPPPPPEADPFAARNGRDMEAERDAAIARAEAAEARLVRAEALLSRYRANYGTLVLPP